MITKIYEGEKTLQDNEYLLKIRPSDKVGYLSKLTKKGELPKAFESWDDYRSILNEPLDIHIFVEDFCSGWSLVGWRFGESQNWAKLMHPAGFILEIHLTQFLDIVKENTIVNGLITGSFKWEPYKLIKE